MITEREFGAAAMAATMRQAASGEISEEAFKRHAALAAWALKNRQDPFFTEALLLLDEAVEIANRHFDAKNTTI